MYREIMLTGIGGQGVQLCAKTLAGAGVAEGRDAMLLGHYGSSMRGGQTDASVVVGDAPLRALPILPSAWSAFVMSPDYWPDTRDRIRAGGVIVANEDLVEDVGRPDCQVFGVSANAIASELGGPMSAGYVLLGAYAAITELVGIEALVETMRQLVPAYRTQHLVANEAALRGGYEVAPRGASPAWTPSATASSVFS
jgi:2-oxoglutarate ferredoxin oxidoreductase subunit gamma